MKILFFDDFRLGVLKDDVVVDVIVRGQGRAASRAARSHQRRDRAFRQVPQPDWSRRPAWAAPSSSPRSRSARRCRARSTSTAWRSTTWRTARARKRRHQRLPQVARCGVRTRRHHGAARRAGHAFRRRGRACGGDRQGRLPDQGRRRDEPRLRLHELHRRLRARPEAAGQHLLSDEVAPGLCADRPLHRHRRRDQEPEQAPGPAVEQRRR